MFHVCLSDTYHGEFQVTQGLLHLYFDGKIVGEKSLTSSLNNDMGSDNSIISLTCISGKDSQLDGYVYSSELFPTLSTIENHYVKVNIIVINVPKIVSIHVFTSFCYVYLSGSSSSTIY